MERLLERLKGVRHIHVDWEPSAAHLTPEERAKILNDAFDEVDSGRAMRLDFGDSRIPHYFGA